MYDVRHKSVLFFGVQVLVFGVAGFELLGEFADATFRLGGPYKKQMPSLKKIAKAVKFC